MSGERTGSGIWGKVLAGAMGGGLLLLIIASIVFSTPELDRSILGTQGFANAARESADMKIEFFSGSGQLKAEDYGLRVLPLYDPDIYDFKANAPIEDSWGREVLRTMDSAVFRRKIASIPTLVTLPKWREGAMKLERLHPDLLIKAGKIRLPHQGSNKVGASEVRRGEAGFETGKIKLLSPDELSDFRFTGELALYGPQTISTESHADPMCKPVVGFGSQTVIARCRYAWNSPLSFWLLTDPDILNNHGAGNGDNFRFASRLVAHLAAGKPILVDGTSRIFTETYSRPAERSRSFADLARFFAWPFTMAWIALIIVCLFTLWHAWRRIGPVIDREKDEAIDASKATAVEASVAILRGVDRRGANDLQLAFAFVTQRMDALVRDVFGTSRKAGQEGEKQFFSALRRRDPTLAENLETVRSNLSPNAASLSKQALFANLEQFEHYTREARHEFGRPSNSR